MNSHNNPRNWLIPFSQMKKLVFRETTQLVQGHAASEQIQNILRLKPVSLSIMLYFFVLISYKWNYEVRTENVF